MKGYIYFFKNCVFYEGRKTLAINLKESEKTSELKMQKINVLFNVF